MSDFWYFEGQSWTLYPTLWDFRFFWYHFLSDFDRWKIFYSIATFAFLTIELAWKIHHTTKIWNFQFELLLSSGPRMVLNVSALIEKLGWYLELPQTRFMLIRGFISIWYGYRARQGQIWWIVGHVNFGLTCDVISDPEVNSIQRPSINFRCLSNAVRLSQIGAVVPEIGGSSKYIPQPPCQSCYENTSPMRG